MITFDTIRKILSTNHVDKVFVCNKQEYFEGDTSNAKEVVDMVKENGKLILLINE